MLDDTIIRNKARTWAKTNHPDASVYHVEAFVNSVAYLVTGMSAGSGPSMREHLVSWSMAGMEGIVESLNVGGQSMPVIYPDGRLPHPGSWKFEPACQYASPLCFDPADKYRKLLIQIQEREHCFDDDPEDVKALCR